MGKHEHGAVDHIVPIKMLVGTCLALLFLTAVTVWVAELDFNIMNIPSMNLIVALSVASLKVFIVSMIFMHLRWDRSFIGFLFVVSCLLVSPTPLWRENEPVARLSRARHQPERAGIVRNVARRV